MTDLESKTKVNRISKEELTEEIDVMFGLERDMESWNNCYFTRVKSDLFHESGTCMACDWKQYINTLSDKDIAQFNFIEAWEWPEIWLRKKQKK